MAKREQIQTITNKDTDTINPRHYISDSGIEVIDVIDAFTKNLSGIEAIDTANIIKYACRWHQKNGLEDIKKLKWYAEHLIECLENKEIKKGEL